MHGPIDEVYRKIRGDRMVEVKFIDGMDVGLSVIRSSPHVRNVQVHNNSVTLELMTDDRGVAELCSNWFPRARYPQFRREGADARRRVHAGYERVGKLVEFTL